MKAFLFELESSQPSALSLLEIRRFGFTSGSILDLHKLIAVRIAHCLHKACLALLACQTELALAYLELLVLDAQQLCESEPEYMTAEMVKDIKATFNGLRKKEISPENCRKHGHALRVSVSAFAKYAEELHAQQRRESAALH